MPTNQQRREAERRRLQRQLAERREREAARRRFTLIASIVGTLVVIVGVVVAVVVATSGGSGKKPSASGAAADADTAGSKTAAATTTAPAAPAAPATPCASPTKSATVSFKGVTVRGATDLAHQAQVTSLATAAPAALACADVVLGKGAAATPTSQVSIHYVGVLYRNGVKFDSSYEHAANGVAQFALTGVVPGFTQGIGGAGKVAPMRVGGRRIIIVPSALGYGAQASGSIPANSPLVFVVDLLKIGS